MFIRALILASLVSMIACSRRTQEKATLPPAASAARPSVRVVPAADRLGVGIARVSGAIRSKSEATLSARFTGQILKLDVRVGDRVKRGQALVAARRDERADRGHEREGRRRCRIPRTWPARGRSSTACEGVFKAER